MLTDPPDRPVESVDSATLGTQTLMQLKANDQLAWSRVVRTYYPRVHNWIRGAGLDDDSAFDVCQDVFRSVLLSLQNFHIAGDDSTFGGWLRRITQRRIADHYRRFSNGRGQGGTNAVNQLNELPDPLGNIDAHTDEPASVNSYSMVLDRVKNEVSEQDWKAFELACLEGFSSGEIANKLGMSVNSVYLAKSRIKKRMNEMLAGLDDE